MQKTKKKTIYCDIPGYVCMVCTRLMKWKWKETDGFRQYLRNSFNVTSMLDYGRCRRKGDVKDNF